MGRGERRGRESGLIACKSFAGRHGQRFDLKMREMIPFLILILLSVFIYFQQTPYVASRSMICSIRRSFYGRHMLLDNPIRSADTA